MSHRSVHGTFLADIGEWVYFQIGRRHYGVSLSAHVPARVLRWSPGDGERPQVECLVLDSRPAVWEVSPRAAGARRLAEAIEARRELTAVVDRVVTSGLLVDVNGHPAIVPWTELDPADLSPPPVPGMDWHGFVVAYEPERQPVLSAFTPADRKERARRRRLLLMSLERGRPVLPGACVKEEPDGLVVTLAGGLGVGFVASKALAAPAGRSLGVGAKATFLCLRSGHDVHPFDCRLWPTAPLAGVGE